MPFPVDKRIEGYQVEYGPDLYVHCKSFQKKRLRIACLTFETVVFTFYYLNPFFQVAGTQHYLGIGLYSVPITLFADGRVDFTYG